MCNESVLVRAHKMVRLASILEDDPNSTFLLPYGAGHYYHVPAENVMAKPTRTNLKSCGEIDALLCSRSPEAWKRCLAYGRVMRIRGVEGNALYTTFAPTDGCLDEQRVLRLVPWRVAHACFPEVKGWAMRDPGYWSLSPERMAVYDWSKEADLPNAPRLDPVLNNWPEATLTRPVAARTPLQMPPLDPMEDADAQIFGDVGAHPTTPPPLPPPLSWEPPPAPERGSRRRDRAPFRLPPSLLPRQPPPLALAMAEDLRALSDFLFECKDVVPEGAYLQASDALKRVWDRSI